MGATRLRDWALRLVGRAVLKAAPVLTSVDMGPGFIGRSNLGSRARQVQAYQGLVATCVNRVSEDVAGLEARLYKRRGRRRDDWAEVGDHPLLDLLDRPNPLFSGFDLVRLSQAHLELTGMAFWLVVPNRLGRPAELWPLFPQHLIRIVTGRDSSEIIKGFAFRGEDGRERVLDPDEVIYLRLPHPESMVYGASTVQAQAYAYDVSLAFSVYHRNLLQNSARPDVVLKSDQHLTEEEAGRAKARWKASFGGPERAGDVVVLGAGLEPKPLTVSSRDAEFMALAGWSQDLVLAAFGVPAGKLGLVKDVNRANMQELDTTYHRESLHPRARRWTAALTALAARYDADLWCELHHEVPKDREFEHKAAMERLDHGAATVNEVRAEDGLEPVPGGDVPRLPANMVPLGAGVARGDRGGAEKLGARPPAVKGAAEDEALWLNDFAAQVDPWTALMQGRLVVVFQRQAAVTLGRLRSLWPRLEGKLAGWGRAKVRSEVQKGLAEVELVLADWDAWGEELTHEVWERTLPWVIQEGGQASLAAFGFGISFNLRDQRVLDWLESNAATAAKVNDHTRDRLRHALVEAVKSGEGFDQATRRVEEVFGWCERERAETIARTEVSNARRLGYHEGLVQSGAPFVKEWRSEPGARPTHAAAATRYGEGKGIALEARFAVGGCTCQVPGHSGCAAEDINCRCYLVYRPAPSAKAISPEASVIMAPARAYTQEECHA